MKKFFCFQTGKVCSSSTIDIEGMNDLMASVHKEEVTDTQPRYNIRVKELKKIHKVALLGDIWNMEQLLLRGKNVNKRDKRKRTPLHLACTIGHADMVDFLVERKCKLDLYDGDYRTPLMKAVQYQEEACVTTLLEHGANPDLTDKFGNTALHYAVAGENTSIVEKLILYHANIEARNKVEFTPFLLAVNENNHKMVELLIREKADVHVVDKFKRTALMLAAPSKSPDIVRLLLQQGVNTSSRDERGWTAGDYALFSGSDGNHQIIAKHTEERLKNFSQNNNPANKTSEEDCIISISIKPGDDDASWPASGVEDLSLNTKNTSKPNLRKQMNVSQHFKNSKLGLVSPGDKTLFENDNSDNKCEHTVGVPSIPSIDACDSSPLALPTPDSILKPPFTLLGLGLTKEGEERPATGTKDDGITESVPQAQTVNDCLTSADRADKNDRHVTLSALAFTEQTEESPWDSESNSESLPETYVVHLPGNADQKGASTLNEQVEDCMECTLCTNPIVSIPLQPPVKEKGSVPKKGGEMEKKQTSKSDFSAELDLEMTTEKEEESCNESENKHLQVSVRQLQEELANTLKTLSMSEASLEVKSRCCTNLEDEVKDLKEKLAQSRNQVDDLTAKLETVSSRNQVLIEELSSMKEIQRKCEKLEKNKKKLEQQVVKLRSSVEVNMLEYSKMEQYKRDFEETTRLNVAEKLKEVDLFLEMQVAFQDSLAQVKEKNYASVRSQMELRIKELEFELSKMKKTQDVTKTELDRYKHLYLEEVTHRMSLTNELNKTSAANMRPSPDLPYGRNVN
ncbi:ankyrin repeat domain-containing protein 26-like, partial [Mustela erminea]|uniref:ankyrin repeat domain-containing protein 26-like n=1 Tax=Mustela erminea TaxID=36723 RepID=UPI001386FD61